MLSRVAIIGLPGSGKSTFAVQLGQSLDIPVYHLDRYAFLSGGKKLDKESFLQIQQDLVNGSSWIIEGCALSSLEMRVARADAVFYFRLPRLLCIWRIFKRYFFPDKTLLDKGEGCTQVLNWELIKYTWNFVRDKKQEIDAMRTKYPKVKFIEFKSSSEAATYLSAFKNY